MADRRLTKEEIVTLNTLIEKKASNSAISRILGTSEGAVRYHRKKRSLTSPGNGNAKESKAMTYEGLISDWMEKAAAEKRPANIRELHEYLSLHYGYEHSYKSILRYVRKKFPRPPIRTYRRVELAAGAQSQTDWGEFPQVCIGGVWKKLYAFILVLSHSRMWAAVWSESMDQLHWHQCHNEAFRRLGGIPAVNRIDNLKTGVASGAGATGVINAAYSSYARSVGFHVDLCPPRSGNAKGKVEAKVKQLRKMLPITRREWSSIEELQQETDRAIERYARNTICPATGKTIHASWQDEVQLLRPPTLLPEPFDKVVTRVVRTDCCVFFENRQYTVPFQFVKEPVEIRGCADRVQILAHGKVVKEYPRHTEERILIDRTCYEGPATDRALPPPPQGKLTSRLEEVMALGVQTRSIDYYAKIAEVAR